MTDLETKVLLALEVCLDHCEPGFSDVQIDDISCESDLQEKIARGVVSSLVKKGMMEVVITDVNGRDKNFYYLTDKGLVCSKILSLGIENF
jgi:predicted transcriptional regulator